MHFCGFYGIKLARSIPGHPWNKGKVEKPFDYLENHFIIGNEFENFTDLRAKLKAFQDETNLLLHGTTGEIPKVRFETKEAVSLNLLSTVNSNFGIFMGIALLLFVVFKYGLDFIFNMIDRFKEKNKKK